MSIIARVLGLAAVLAAARAAWLHHQDNQAVIRTDLMRDAFAAGQAAERNRAAEEADTARRAAYYGPPPMPDELRETAREMFRERFGSAEPEGHGWSEWGEGHGGTSR